MKLILIACFSLGWLVSDVYKRMFVHGVGLSVWDYAFAALAVTCLMTSQIINDRRGKAR